MNGIGMKKLLTGANDTLLLNNFFSDPELIREYALKQKYYSHQESKSFSSYSGKYTGRRTKEIYSFNPELFDVLCRDIFSKIIDLTNVEFINWKVSAYFHIQNSNDKVRNTIHTDNGILYAGLIYLTPNISESSGTSLYEKKWYGYKVIEKFPNRYNSLVMYNASTYHGPSDFADDRLTLPFFIKGLEIGYKV